MKRKFKGEPLSGHKEFAIEVPFDPSLPWDVGPHPLWRGRRGHPAIATIKDIPFESAIVPRQKKFYLLVDATTRSVAELRPGNVVQVAIAPYPD